MKEDAAGDSEVAASSQKPQDDAKHSCYTKYFPFELLFLFFQLSERLYVFLYQQYYFQRLTRDHLAALTNYTSPHSSICTNQSYVVQFTGNATFLRLQERVNSLNLYTEVTFYCLSAASTLLLGSLSDTFGRKPIFCLGMLGTMLMSVVNLIVVYFDVDIEYYLLTAVFYGGMGGFSTMVATTAVAILDTTSGRWVVIRLSIAEACVGVSRALTSVTGNNWTQAIGCNFLPPAWLLLGIGVGGLGFSLLTPESHPRTRRRGSMTSGVRKVINGLKIYTLPKYLGLQKWILLWTATLVICCTAVAVAAEFSIINFFLHNEPLEWSYDTIGIFGAVQATCICVSLVVLLPLFIMLGCSDTMVCFMGGVMGVITNILMGLLTIDWAVYLVGCVQGFMIVCYPTTRSYIAKLTTDSKGAIFAIASSLQTVFNVLAVVVANTFYHPQTETRGHKTDPHIVFWITTTWWGIAVVLIILLMMYDRCKCMMVSSHECDSEKKSLLKSSPSSSIQ